MIKESLEFGEGSFVGAVMRDPSFFDLPQREQARILGWADGCPVVTELTDPDNPNVGRGPEAMIARYGQVNFWFGYISREVEERNPQLYAQLMTPVPRAVNEPVGKYEPESVPDAYLTQMAPMGTLAGYSLPRLFIEQIGANKDLGRAELNQRLNRGQVALERAIDLATTPNELLALAAREIARADLEPLEVLRQVLSKGWLGEHNAVEMLNEFKIALGRLAPELWAVYIGLSVEGKQKLKLA